MGTSVGFPTRIEHIGQFFRLLLYARDASRRRIAEELVTDIFRAP